MSDENKNLNDDYLLEDDLDMHKDPNEGRQEEFKLDDNKKDVLSKDEQFDEEENIPPEAEKAKNELLNENLTEEEQVEEEDIMSEEEQVEEENIDRSNHDLNFLNSEEKADDSVSISRSKIILAKALLENVKESNEKLIQIFSNISENNSIAKVGLSQVGEIDSKESGDNEEGSIIEGVFDGENMIGPDGKQYSVPANYASKSKLVEGDILKLTITEKGTFVYKQIGPIERLRIVGELEKNNEDSFIVNADGKRWKILPASVTYFKGSVGDEVVLLIPKAGESKWAAVENIIRNKDNKEYLDDSF